ncbi:hypothetical protein LK996_14845 [Lysobacter sp. A6]|uniref:TonB-dependent receptor plug domain-containing protein n=1 Tax=Noviluteimonas lactosilytica TaxID=2888523 RepID=A0ABS8JL74_9GAMM|nr:hypothetical protein [Lysobacter lactosilyticus]MCC8364349.1 hypothetical protein [Lysobacter lactosilyticus]
MDTQCNARTCPRRTAAGCAWLLAFAAPIAFAQSQSFGTPVDPATLESQRGGDGTIVVDIDIDLVGQVDDNTASNIVTGQNLIDGGSFANSAGIATVIQNSGSNVLIQNGMAVSVLFVDPGVAAPP